jgi:predicted nuclease of predicted toxin-antitoxin system
MKAKLLLDEDVHFGLASALRKRGYDVIHTQELEMNMQKADLSIGELLYQNSSLLR